MFLSDYPFKIEYKIHYLSITVNCPFKTKYRYTPLDVAMWHINTWFSVNVSYVKSNVSLTSSLGVQCFPQDALKRNDAPLTIFKTPLLYFLSGTNPVRDKRNMLNQSCLQMLAILSEPWCASPERFSPLYSVFWDHEASMTQTYGLPCCLIWQCKHFKCHVWYFCHQSVSGFSQWFFISDGKLDRG